MDNFKKIVTIWATLIATTFFIAYNIPNAFGVICGIITAYSGLALLWYVVVYICVKAFSPIMEQTLVNHTTEEKQNFFLIIIAIFTILNFFK